MKLGKICGCWYRNVQSCCRPAPLFLEIYSCPVVVCEIDFLSCVSNGSMASLGKVKLGLDQHYKIDDLVQLVTTFICVHMHTLTQSTTEPLRDNDTREAKRTRQDTLT